MSVNLSARQFQASRLVDEVATRWRDAGLDAVTLVLEITETVMMADTDVAVERLHELKELGVRLAIDDFGTGYSSLSYLQRFPVDILKIDRSFVDADRRRAGLAAAIVGLGATPSASSVVAEGIELPDQTDSLRGLGCELGQGFLFARPMPPADLATYLERVSAQPAHLTKRRLRRGLAVQPTVLNEPVLARSAELDDRAVPDIETPSLSGILSPDKLYQAGLARFHVRRRPGRLARSRPAWKYVGHPRLRPGRIHRHPFGLSQYR